MNATTSTVANILADGRAGATRRSTARSAMAPAAKAMPVAIGRTATGMLAGSCRNRERNRSHERHEGAFDRREPAPPCGVPDSTRCTR